MLGGLGGESYPWGKEGGDPNPWGRTTSPSPGGGGSDGMLGGPQPLEQDHLPQPQRWWQ